MEATQQLRTVKRQETDGNLTTIDFRELRSGDKFRLYEPAGVEPKEGDENGETLYIATEDAVALDSPAYAGVKAEPAAV